MQKKEIRKEILRLSMPASLEVVFQMLLGLIDMIFVGKLGTDALASASLTSQIVSLMLLVYGTIGIGASILIAQYYGKNDIKSVSNITGQSLLLALLIGICTAVVLLLFAGNILHVMGAESHVVQKGAPFFKIIALSMPWALLSIVASAVLRSIGNTKAPFIITSISVVLNTVLNYFLIFGIAHIPALGVIGSAYATLSARVIAALLVLYYLFFVNQRVKLQFAHLLVCGRIKSKKLLQLTCPIAMGELIWALGTFLYTLLFTQLGTDQLVASQIIANVENLFIMFSFGISISGLVLVAKEIGAGDFVLMNKKANEILKVGLVASMIFGLGLLTVSNCIDFFYPQVNANANNMARWGLIFFALFQPVKVTNMIMGNGILKSGGITKFVVLVDILVAFVIGLPIAYILGIYCNMGFKGILIGRIGEEISRIFTFMVRYKTPHWYKILSVDNA